MFCFNSLSPGSFHHKMIRSVFALFVVSALLFAGCQEPEDSGNLDGIWSDSFNTIKIDTSTMTIEFVNFGFDQYHGNIASSSDFSAVNGILIFEITKYWEFTYDENWSIIETNLTDDHNGKFSALYWANLTSNSAGMSDVFLNNERVIVSTLEEAQNIFTSGNEGTYTFFSAPYIKQ